MDNSYNELYYADVFEHLRQLGYALVILCVSISFIICAALRDLREEEWWSIEFSNRLTVLLTTLFVLGGLLIVFVPKKETIYLTLVTKLEKTYSSNSLVYKQIISYLEQHQINRRKHSGE